MGAYISFTNHIHISHSSHTNGVLKYTGYKDIDDEFIRIITENRKIRWVQIDDYLPEEAYSIIDRIFEARPDMSFRIFHFLKYDSVDISFLKDMKHVHRVWIDTIDFRDRPNRINFSVLEELSLKSLNVSCFDLRDYSFIKRLSFDLEELTIYAETTGGNVNFDCEWLVQYKSLHTLWLGKKASKHIECLIELPALRFLSLRGIKIKDFDFLKQLHLDKLALLWNSNNDLHELSNLTRLKEIELWRINKLEDVSFIESLTNLEVIKLQDLKHVKKLPELTNHLNLKHIYLIDTGIDESTLTEKYRKIVEHWDNR